MAAFAMQYLGCDVSALNTVQFSMLSAAQPPTGLLAPLLTAMGLKAITLGTSNGKAPKQRRMRSETSTKASAKAISTTLT